MTEKKLTMEEAEKISGGRFNFDIDYDMRMRNANIRCPVCGAEHCFESAFTGYEGYSDGRWVATDDGFCKACGVQLTLFPEQNLMAVKDERGCYSEERYPFVW